MEHGHKFEELHDVRDFRVGFEKIVGQLPIKYLKKIRQISILKIPAIFELNRSLQGFDKQGVADVSFRCPNRIC